MPLIVTRQRLRNPLSVDAVKGYQSAPQSLGGNLMGANLDQDAIRELSTRKQNLLMELNNYAENRRMAQEEPKVKPSEF